VWDVCGEEHSIARLDVLLVSLGATVNPAANAAETGLVFVRLSRECLAVHGKAFGTGYVERPDREDENSSCS
jgi:hypothetical protein